MLWEWKWENNPVLKGIYQMNINKKIQLLMKVI